MRRTRYQYGNVTREKRKRAADIWVYRFYDPTGAHKKVLIGTVGEYPTKAAAIKAAEPLRAMANPDDPRVSSLDTVIHHYIQEEMPERTSTRTFYLPWLNNYIQPKWGSYEMRRIQPFAVEQWLKTLNLAPKSKAHIRSLMRILFSSAMRYGFIPVTQNPMSLVRVPGCTKREREPRVLTADECRSILGYLNDPWRTMVLVAMCLGLRVSEILGLKWSDFDFTRNMVLVQRAWVVGAIGDVKTRYSRKQMPLDASLVVALLSYRPKYECCEWVFANPDTNRPWWAHHIQQQRIAPAAVKANVGAGIGWHTFRHTYSSMLRNLGVDVKVQQELLRHADIRTTMNTYTQAMPSALREANSRVVRLVLQ
ncbi:MAG TPA: site-specific integrase [Terriglobales bacterium]|nr:site-specific integrase [Terriglobales bacterium]